MTKECRICNRRLPLDEFKATEYISVSGDVESRLFARCNRCRHYEFQLDTMQRQTKKLFANAIPFEHVESMYKHRAKPKRLAKFIDNYKTIISAITENEWVQPPEK